jgi:hypothetical protein
MGAKCFGLEDAVERPTDPEVLLHDQWHEPEAAGCFVDEKRPLCGWQGAKAFIADDRQAASLRRGSAFVATFDGAFGRRTKRISAMSTL